MMRVAAALIILGCCLSVSSFSSPTQKICTIPNRKINNNKCALLAVVEETTGDKVITDSTSNLLEIPLTYNEMIQQGRCNNDMSLFCFAYNTLHSLTTISLVSQCMNDAYEQGITRQIVRILLPRDASNDQLGQYFEADAETNDRTRTSDIKLVPSDESWQGGIMQLYRAAEPTTRDILKSLCPTSATTGVPPKIIEDRSIDESGVDGVGLLYTQTGSSDNGDSTTTNSNGDNVGGFGIFGDAVKLPTLADNDMCIFVQPNQEVAEYIDDLSSKSSSQLLALLNPQWRNVDDALDSASKSDNVFGQFASFLGGKGPVLRRLDDLQYRATYTLEGYVCKGGNVRLIKRFDSDWVAFAENDDGTKFVKLGSMGQERPTYQDVEKLLDDAGVGYKYARDLGMAPKL